MRFSYLLQKVSAIFLKTCVSVREPLWGRNLIVLHRRPFRQPGIGDSQREWHVWQWSRSGWRRIRAEQPELDDRALLRTILTPTNSDTGSAANKGNGCLQGLDFHYEWAYDRRNVGIGSRNPLRGDYYVAYTDAPADCSGVH